MAFLSSSRRTRRWATVTLLLTAAGPLAAGDGFEITVGERGDDRGVFVRETGDGGFVAVGVTEVEGDDVYLVRTDGSGRILWTNHFGGPGDDWGWSVHELDGGYLVAGSTTSSGSGGFDCYLVATDAEGRAVWSRTFGGENDDRCWAMIPDGEGWMIAGETSRGGKGTEDCYLLNVDAKGEKRWATSFGGEASDRCFSIAPSSEGWILAGATFSRGAGDRDFWVVGVSAKGKPLWEKTWGGARSDVAHWIAPTADGHFLVTGYTTSLAEQGDNPMLVKLTGSGEEVWSRVLPYEGVAHAITGVERAEGGLCLTGFLDRGGRRSALLVGTDSEGGVEWSQRIRETRGDSFGYSVAPTSDGGCVMTGHTTEGSRGGRDLLLVKLDPASGDPIDPVGEDLGENELSGASEGSGGPSKGRAP